MELPDSESENTEPKNQEFDSVTGFHHYACTMYYIDWSKQCTGADESWPELLNQDM